MDPTPGRLHRVDTARDDAPVSISDKKAADLNARADDGEQNVESASRPIPYVPKHFRTSIFAMCDHR